MKMYRPRDCRKWRNLQPARFRFPEGISPSVKTPKGVGLIVSLPGNENPVLAKKSAQYRETPSSSPARKDAVLLPTLLAHAALHLNFKRTETKYIKQPLELLNFLEEVPRGLDDDEQVREVPGQLPRPHGALPRAPVVEPMQQVRDTGEGGRAVLVV